MADKQLAIPPRPPPSMRDQSALDLLLLGSLHASLAQMLGLSCVDQTAAVGARYDYLIVADHQGVLGGTAWSALDFIQSHRFAPGRRVHRLHQGLAAPDPPLAAPGALRGFALPGGSATMPGAAPSDAGAAA